VCGQCAGNQDAADTRDLKVILHVGDADRTRLGKALDKTEELLAAAERSQRSIKLEVIANGGGLNLLRADTSPFRERIQNLQSRHANLVLLACKHTLERLKLEKGIDVQLLPGVKVGNPALEHIITRLEKGWVYVRT
jgi:intracellular sulfur oxidation DsrE/DsrF family protein